jgi:cytochrome P450
MGLNAFVTYTLIHGDGLRPGQALGAVVASGLLFALLSHEGAWEGLRREPSCIPRAVDEALRWETPVAVLPRMSRSEPIEFHGVGIPANSWVLFGIAGANRDPEHYASPDRFEIDRVPTDTLTFGRGVKSCPGMHLARKNLSVALEVLLERLPALELLDPEAAVPRRTVLRSPDALRVRQVRR